MFVGGGGRGGGWRVTLTFACYPNYFVWFKLLNFVMFLVSRFFPNYFTGTYANLSRHFFGYVNFHRNFGGVSLKMFVFMAFL